MWTELVLRVGEIEGVRGPGFMFKVTIEAGASERGVGLKGEMKKIQEFLLRDV